MQDCSVTIPVTAGRSALRPSHNFKLQTFRRPTPSPSSVSWCESYHNPDDGGGVGLRNAAQLNHLTWLSARESTTELCRRESLSACINSLLRLLAAPEIRTRYTPNTWQSLCHSNSPNLPSFHPDQHYLHNILEVNSLIFSYSTKDYHFTSYVSSDGKL
jgi:hypothetical protein